MAFRQHLTAPPLAPQPEIEPPLAGLPLANLVLAVLPVATLALAAFPLAMLLLTTVLLLAAQQLASLAPLKLVQARLLAAS